MSKTMSLDSNSFHLRAYSSGQTQLTAREALLRPKKRFRRFIRSSSTAGMPINPLPERQSPCRIPASHPSHRSSFTRMTCIKDGFFFCALSDAPVEVDA